MKTKKLYDEYMITGMVAGFEPIEIVSASGTKIKGSDGVEYLDCFSGISVVNAGHNRKEILDAAKEQMDQYVHGCTYVYYNRPAGELAKKLAEITPPGLKKSFFANSGAEAVEGAIRLAKRFTGKSEIIALTRSFHGRTVGTLSVSGNKSRKIAGGPYLSGIAFAPSPYAYRCPFGSKTDKEYAERKAEYLRDVIRYQTSGDIAAFIAEPILGEGGIIVPHENYFKLVKKILDEENILFIADEVQSGFCRTGKMFAIEHYGVNPDILCMAKGIADGFPLSAFTAREDVGNAFKPGDHLSTFGGNPVCCAASLANIQLLKDEKLAENAEKTGRMILSRLRSFQEKHKLIGEVRGKGLMIGLELVKDKNKTPADSQARAVRTLCRENGILVGIGGVFGNVIRIQPPLILTAEEANRVCETLEKVIKQVEPHV
jgi:4-aminobutyrate aminotransferase